MDAWNDERYGDNEWGLTYPESQAGSQSGGSGAGLPGFDNVQVPGYQPPAGQSGSGGGGSANISGPGVSGYNGPLPSGASKEWAEDFLRRNPHDEHRLQSAWESQRTGGGSGSSSSGGGGGGGFDWASYQAAQMQRIRDMQARVAQIRATSNPTLSAAMKDEMSRTIASTLQAQGHKVTWDGSQLIVDGRPYIIPTDANAWQPTGLSSYQPGEIGMEDIPNFSYESLLEQMGTPEVDAYMKQLLANPESLDAKTVDMMKAKSKDELAELGLQDEQRLKELGSSYGIQESPWLAAATAGQQAARGRELVGKNRDIEIEAAKQNAADRRAVAELGIGYAGARTNRVASAANAALQKAAATQDRLALREQVKQTAAELNIKAEQVLAQHIQFKLEDATRRYGIDMDEALKEFGIEMDSSQFMANLKQQDDHFKEELAMKMTELEDLRNKWRAEYEQGERAQDFLEDKFTWEQEQAGLV